MADYLFTDLRVSVMDTMWLGLRCRACGAHPGRRCVSRNGLIVSSHSVRRHDLIRGRPCTCGKCQKGKKPRKKPLDNGPQN